MRLLELFCGTKSVGQVFEKIGYEIISLDYNPKFNATHTENILTWDYTIYPPDHFDVIWASPDCRSFSLAGSGKHRSLKNIYGYTEIAELSNKMIYSLIKILKYFNCKAWFIENPRALLQHYPPFTQFIKDVNANKNLVYYGNYNWGFPKPTNIWSNLTLWENEKFPILDENTYKIIKRKCDGKDAKYYFAYYDVSSEERSKIPPALINKLIDRIPK